MPESEMSNPVRWWGEERGGTVKNIYYLEELFVSTDEGFQPISVFEGEEEGYEEDAVQLPKGHPILNVD